MATRSPAPSSFRQEKVNYIRLSNLLIEIGRKVLKDIFDSIHIPTNLHGTLWSSAVHSKLNKLRSKGVLYKQQWDTLYAPSGAVTSANFDITMLFLLLRNICGLKPPGTGWDNAPLPTDISLEADLVRIKRCRNGLAHNAEQALTDSEMENHWIEMETVLTRLGGPRYLPDIQRLKVQALDPEDENNFDVLQQAWEEGERCTLEAVRKIDEKFTNFEKRFEKMSLNTTKEHITINGCIKILAAGSAVAVACAVGSNYFLNRYQDDPETIIRLLNKAVVPGAFASGAVGAFVYAILPGSFKIIVEVHTVVALEQLWESYVNGNMKTNLEKVIITDEMLRLVPNDIEKVEISVTISERDYKKTRENLIVTALKIVKENINEGSYAKEPPSALKGVSNIGVSYITDARGKLPAMIYEANKLTWPVTYHLLKEGSILPVIHGKIAIEVNDPLKAISMALLESDEDINLEDMAGKTLLMHAVSERREDLVIPLLDAGADLNMVDMSGKSAMKYAIECKDQGIVNTLKKVASGGRTVMSGLNLTFAAKHGNEESVITLIKDGVDLDFQDVFFRRTPLMYAALSSKDNIAKQLINVGADVNIADIDGKTALMFAVQEDREEIVNALMKADADVNVKDRYGKTPLEYAVKNNNEIIVKQLIYMNANVNTSDNEGQTALILASKDGEESAGLVDVLIKSGADVNITDCKGKTALTWAVESRSEKIAYALLKAGGADINLEMTFSQHYGDVVAGVLDLAVKEGEDEVADAVIKAWLDFDNKYDSFAKRPLTWAAEGRHEIIVDNLIKAGANVNGKDGNGKSAVMWAAERGGERIADALIKADADVNANDKDGKTALIFAAKFGNERIADALIKADADVNVNDKDGKTALIFAAEFGNERIVDALIKAGADVNAKDTDRKSAVMWATENGRERIVDVLIKAEADVNAKDEREQTPLTIAAKSGNQRIVDALIHAGADVNAKDIYGKSVVMWATDFEHERIVEVLIKAEANVNANDKDGKTALIFAAQSGNERIVNALIKAGADVNAKDTNGKSAVMWATIFGLERVVDMLMSKI